MQVLKGESSYDDQCLLPTPLEKMTKSELVVLVQDHSIVFDHRMTVDKLRTLVVSHILSATCIQSVNVNDWDECPKRCAQSVKIFWSTGQDMESVSFLVFTLSRCAKNMSIKPLQCVLTHLDVPYDNTDSLNQLRRHL